MKRFIANALMSVCALFSSASAQTPAPSPQGIAVEPLGLVPGMFVHMQETSNRPTFAPGSEVCIRRSGIRNWRGAHAEYWYYRAGELQALFKRESVISFNARCIPESREVRTARVHRADGPLRAPNGAEAQWLHPLQSSIECVEQDARCSPGVIAGIESLCVSGGDGFISVSQCVSRSDGPSRGILLSLAISDDVGSQFRRVVDTVDEHTLIDLSLFQRRETW